MADPGKLLARFIGGVLTIAGEGAADALLEVALSRLQAASSKISSKKRGRVSARPKQPEIIEAEFVEDRRH